jgi:hypothetical protein
VTDPTLLENLLGIVVHNHYGHQLAGASMTRVIQWTTQQLFRLAAVDHLLLPYLEWMNSLLAHTHLQAALAAQVDHVMRVYYQTGTLPAALTHAVLRAVNRLAVQFMLRLRVGPELTAVNHRLLSDLLSRVTDRGDISEMHEKRHHELIALFVHTWWQASLTQRSPDMSEITRRLHQK